MLLSGGLHSPRALGVLAAALLGASSTLVWSAPARAERAATSEAIDRMKEGLRPAVESGSLQAMLPVLLVAATPAFEETRAWFPTAASAALVEVLGSQNVRVCEACMNVRVHLAPGRMEHNSNSISVAEAAELDRNGRGAGAPARAAVWVEETPGGVAVRIVSLENSQLIFVRNFDARLREQERTTKNFNRTIDLERRRRGDSLTHLILDGAIYPGQHVSMDIVDQFGERNLDMAGITASAFDPVVGVGAAYHHVFPEAFNVSLGAQVIVSVPTLLVTSISGDVTAVIDPLLTGVLVVRLPIPETNYAVLLTGSTNGRFGIGVSFLAPMLIPVIP